MKEFMQFFKIVIPSIYKVKPGKSIAKRAALLSWCISMVTMAIFVLVTIPQQKKNYLDSLKSKANGVAVSMHEVSAGAAVNEDFASVVSAAQTMLVGDNDLEFIIIARNTGFSLIIEQSGWRAEPEADTYWLPHKRNPDSGIKMVPLFNRKVFHYAQPFDYSGIQWGWIHVGLSLKNYDQSVNSLYRNTAIMALGCLLFSFLISLVYAAWLIRPILSLRRIVEVLANGDFSIRAEMNREDELGSLAISINRMADALLKRDRILESVRFAAQQFMQNSKWEETIDSVLAKIGLSAEVGRVVIFKNHQDDAGRLYADRQYEWNPKDFVSKESDPKVQKFFYDDNKEFVRWSIAIGQKQILSSPVSGISKDIRAIFERQGILSLIAIPIFVEETWWGIMLLADLIQERIWSDAEKDSLSAGADILGATIARQRFQDELLEAKKTLEQRVLERTRELELQVLAKQKALIELAEAQSSLVEMSRAAGMAEVATGVLHNVGNVLNSVNVSCDLIMNQVRESRIANITKVTDLMAQSRESLGQFLTEDPRGRQIPAYLMSLSPVLVEEQQLILRETQALHQRIQHIKEIVTMQQTYGRVSGVLETIAPEQLMEDALTLNAGALVRHEITVLRQYDQVPPVTVDKHKVLQILLNLIANAKHACSGIDREKQITLQIFCPEPDRLSLQVSDNGVGILPENLIRIFQHGFTTRKTGHGFGLHSGAIAAKGLGGSLTVHSDGPGSGATFTLELPCTPGDR